MKQEITLVNRLIIFLSSIFISSLPLFFKYWLLLPEIPPEQITSLVIKETYAPIVSDIEVLAIIISFSFNIIIQIVAIPIRNKRDNSLSMTLLWILYFICMIIIYTAGGLNTVFRQLYQSTYYNNLVLGIIAMLFCVLYFIRVAYNVLIQ